VSQWDDWHTTVELTGRLCEQYDFRVAHQVLQRLDEHEVYALYCCALDFRVLCERLQNDSTFVDWVAQKAGVQEVER